MTNDEKEIERIFGIETAAVFRACAENISGGLTVIFLKKYVTAWESACRKLIGDKAYVNSRRIRYAKIINDMKKEKEQERVDYLDEQSLLRALKDLE